MARTSLDQHIDHLMVCLLSCITPTYIHFYIYRVICIYIFNLLLDKSTWRLAQWFIATDFCRLHVSPSRPFIVLLLKYTMLGDIFGHDAHVLPRHHARCASIYSFLIHNVDDVLCMYRSRVRSPDARVYIHETCAKLLCTRPFSKGFIHSQRRQRRYISFALLYLLHIDVV